MKDNRLQFIAEISGNHKQDLAECKKLIEDAQESGCDYVKFQCYTPESLTINCSNDHFIIKDKNSPWYGRTYYDLYKDAMTPLDWFPTLFSYCDRVGIKPLCTPFSIEDLNYLESCKCPSYKVAAFEAIDLDFVKKVLLKRKDVFISIGQLTQEQLVHLYMLDTCKKRRVVPLYSISKYPSTVKDIEAHKLKYLNVLFPEFGFSDHSLDFDVTKIAITLGCTIIEKHITRDEKSIDGHFSLNKYMMKSLISQCTQFYNDLFTYNEDCKTYNRSIFAVKDIKRGDRFTSDNVKIIRPGNGLHPEKINLVLASYASDDIRIGTPLTMELLS